MNTVPDLWRSPLVVQVDVDAEQLCQIVEADGPNDTRYFSAAVTSVMDVQRQHSHRRSERDDGDRYAVIQTYNVDVSILFTYYRRRECCVLPPFGFHQIYYAVARSSVCRLS